MEILFFIIIIIESSYIVYGLVKRNKPLDEVEEREKERRENIEKSFQKLFNYNETIAVRGYDNE